MINRISIYLFFSACILFAGTSDVHITVNIDSPISCFNPATNSTNAQISWFGPCNEDTVKNWWGRLSSYTKLRLRLGNYTWDYDSAANINRPSDIIRTFGKESFGEGNHIRFNFGGYGYLPYQYASNWKGAVGPLDSTARAEAESLCGIDLPKRYSAYDLPEMIKLADTLGAMPVFVYMGTCDTTFEIDTVFEYITDEYWDTLTSSWKKDTVTTTRKSLYDDARDFAEYLFGDGSSGWSKLRKYYDGITNPVNTDLVMLGNDVPNMYAMWHCGSVYSLRINYGLYDYNNDKIKDTVGVWPQFPITHALFPAYNETLFLYDSTMNNSKIYSRYCNQYAVRYRARLETVAVAFKAVKPDIKVQAYTTKPFTQNIWPTYDLGLTMAVLAANNIDSYGFNTFISGGHSDGAIDDSRFADSLADLNYADTSKGFMAEKTYPAMNHANSFLLNETLGDIIVMNYMKYYYDLVLDTAAQCAEALFGGIIDYSKPVEITEYTRLWGYRFGEDKNVANNALEKKYFNSMPTIANGIKFLEIMREWNELSREDSLGGIYSYSFSPIKRGMFWGLDSLQRAEYDSVTSYTIMERSSADGGNFYPLANWDDSAATYGPFPSMIAHKLYKNVGFGSLDYTIDIDTLTAQDDVICGKKYRIIPSNDGGYASGFEPNTNYIPCTIDPYIDDDGSITSIIVNRNTDTSYTVFCTLLSCNSIAFDTIEVWKIEVNDSIWKEACYSIYGDSTFLPKGFAHNGFTYDTDTSAGISWARFQPVSLNTDATVDTTDISTFYALTLEPMSFAWVRVKVVPAPGTHSPGGYFTILADSAITVTLPNATTCGGRIYAIRNISGDSVTVTVVESGKIENGDSLTVPGGEGIIVQAEGTTNDWWIIGDYNPDGE